jgi:hypothetical protein
MPHTFIGWVWLHAFPTHPIIACGASNSKYVEVAAVTQSMFTVIPFYFYTILFSFFVVTILNLPCARVCIYMYALIRIR